MNIKNRVFCECFVKNYLEIFPNTGYDIEKQRKSDDNFVSIRMYIRFAAKRNLFFTDKQ